MQKSISVNMPQFIVEALEDGNVVKQITTCSFGREGHRTPIIANGSLSLTKRDRDHHSTIYGGASMPFALFFEQDPTCAFHQGNPQVASHGCIHLLQADAEWLFNWAARDPVALHMTGPYPVPPVKSSPSTPVA
jgi:lipoprotein-anchoring transpeptidase ErfK/SrfK